MLAAMSWEQFMEWVHFFGLEPMPEVRADLRAATIASVIANVNRNPKKRSRPYSPKDFMPDYDSAQKSKKGEFTREQWLAMKAAAKAGRKKAS
jgi:hypothetical protein